MRLAFLFVVIYSVAAKVNLRAMTESNGQEIIEIGAPIKELPPNLEEEPSAESYDIKVATTQSTEIKISKSSVETRRKGKDIDKIDGVSQEDEETKIEKELAEIYKDNADYKAESEEKTGDETTIAPNTEELIKPIGRGGDSFQFQPDHNNKAAVERFRTSIDDISCVKGITRKLDLHINSASDSSRIFINTFIIAILISFL